jgi:hypothetical protein
MQGCLTARDPKIWRCDRTLGDTLLHGARCRRVTQLEAGMYSSLYRNDATLELTARHPGGQFLLSMSMHDSIPFRKRIPGVILTSVV